MFRWNNFCETLKVGLSWLTSHTMFSLRTKLCLGERTKKNRVGQNPNIPFIDHVSKNFDISGRYISAQWVENFSETLRLSGNSNTCVLTPVQTNKQLFWRVNELYASTISRDIFYNLGMIAVHNYKCFAKVLWRSTVTIK